MSFRCIPEFIEGQFLVKTTKKPFNQTSTDQALEHVNKVGKITGPLVGITWSEGARAKWCLTYNERSCLVEETGTLFSIATDNTEYTPSSLKDVGPSRVKTDNQDVEMFMFLSVQS